MKKGNTSILVYLEGDGLDDIIITPPGGGNQPPGGNWPGDDEGDDDGEPPLPGTGNDGFEETLPGYGGNIGGGLHIPTAYELNIQNIAERIINFSPPELSATLFSLTLEYEECEASELAEGRLAETVPIKDSNGNVIGFKIKVLKGLSDKILNLIVSHEMEHIKNYCYNLLAGNFMSNLKNINPSLYNFYNQHYNIDTGTIDFNSAHHNYTASNIDEYERLLRQLFPGYDEKYYIYGKWGSLTKTKAFKQLSPLEKRKIKKYLRQNNL